MGVVPTMQMHYKESRGYPREEVEEERACSAPVALNLSDPSKICGFGSHNIRMLCPQALNV